MTDIKAVLQKNLNSQESVARALRTAGFTITCWNGRRCYIKLDDTLYCKFQELIEFLEENTKLVSEASKNRLLELNATSDDDILVKKHCIITRIFLTITLALARFFAKGNCTKTDYHSRILRLNGSSLEYNESIPPLTLPRIPSPDAELLSLGIPMGPSVFNDEAPIVGVAPIPEPEPTNDTEIPPFSTLTMHRLGKVVNKRYHLRLSLLSDLNDLSNRRDPQKMTALLVDHLYFGRSNKYVHDLKHFFHAQQELLFLQFGRSNEYLRDLKHWLAAQQEAFIQQLIAAIEARLTTSKEGYTLFYRLLEWLNHTKETGIASHPTLETKFEQMVAMRKDDLSFMGDVLTYSDDEWVRSKGEFFHFLKPRQWKAVLNRHIENIRNQIKAALSNPSENSDIQIAITHLQTENMRQEDIPSTILEERLMRLMRALPTNSIFIVISVILETLGKSWEQVFWDCDEPGELPSSFSAYGILIELRRRSEDAMNTRIQQIVRSGLSSLQFVGKFLGTLCTSEECPTIIHALIKSLKNPSEISNDVINDFTTAILATQAQAKIKATFETLWPYVRSGEFGIQACSVNAEDCFREVRDMRSLETVIQASGIEANTPEISSFNLSKCLHALLYFEVFGEQWIVSQYQDNKPIRPKIPKEDRVELMRYRTDLFRIVQHFSATINQYDETNHLKFLEEVYTLLNSKIPVKSIDALILNYLALVEESHLNALPSVQAILQNQK